MERNKIREVEKLRKVREVENMEKLKEERKIGKFIGDGGGRS